jgi:hypothetical protein
MTNLTWKPDWQSAKASLTRWWNREGMAIYLTAGRSMPRNSLTMPLQPISIEAAWLDPAYRCTQAETQMGGLNYLAEAFPYFDTQIGPGSLSTFLGATPEFAIDTVWYYPCLTDPDTSSPIRFSQLNNRWLDAHLALVDEGLRRANGCYLVGIPDLIENLDTLSSLRGDTPLLYDLTERPAWVLERLAEINQAYFEVFNIFYARVKDDDGGNAFSAFKIWGPGKTAKIQCDISASISPRMYQKYVQPYLAEQCAWLDYSLYHLDGTTCLQHVDRILEIEHLNAVEWTPQAGRPGGGSPEWFDLYRRIKAGGKGIQAIDVADEEVLPLLDAVGPEGTYILLADRPRTLNQAEALLKAIEPYRT